MYEERTWTGSRICRILSASWRRVFHSWSLVSSSITEEEMFSREVEMGFDKAGRATSADVLAWPSVRRECFETAQSGVYLVWGLTFGPTLGVLPATKPGWISCPSRFGWVGRIGRPTLEGQCKGMPGRSYWAAKRLAHLAASSLLMYQVGRKHPLDVVSRELSTSPKPRRNGRRKQTADGTSHLGHRGC